MEERLFNRIEKMNEDRREAPVRTWSRTSTVFPERSGTRSPCTTARRTCPCSSPSPCRAQASAVRPDADVPRPFGRPQDGDQAQVMPPSRHVRGPRRGALRTRRAPQGAARRRPDPRPLCARGADDPRVHDARRRARRRQGPALRRGQRRGEPRSRLRRDGRRCRLRGRRPDAQALAPPRARPCGPDPQGTCQSPRLSLPTSELPAPIERPEPVTLTEEPSRSWSMTRPWSRGREAPVEGAGEEKPKRAREEEGGGGAGAEAATSRPRRPRRAEAHTRGQAKAEPRRRRTSEGSRQAAGLPQEEDRDDRDGRGERELVGQRFIPAGCASRHPRLEVQWYVGTKEFPAYIIEDVNTAGHLREARPRRPPDILIRKASSGSRSKSTRQGGDPSLGSRAPRSTRCGARSTS